MTIEYGSHVAYYRHKGEKRINRKIRADRKLPPFEVLLELISPPYRLTYGQIGMIYDCSAPAVFFGLNPDKRWRKPK